MSAAALRELARRARPARGLARDSAIVALGGQLERVLGTLTSFVIRWGLDPTRLGVYTGLRIYLDQTNRSSLGIGLGAVQEIPVLRAAGRHDEARRLADVACTANTITCTLYALGLLAWAGLRQPWLADDPLGAEWTWGLVLIALLTLLQRRLSFHIAVLRAHQEFVVTTELDVFEAVATVAFTAAGVWLGGFWGLLGSVAAILAAKIAYLEVRHPLRFAWAWDGPTVGRLMVIGLPIFANTAVFGFLMTLDRVLVLWLLPDGARAAGLYSVAILGTSWSLDLAGRIVTVLYPHFQATLGRTGDPRRVAHEAARATEAQAPLLFAGSAIACVAGPAFLGAILPRYAEGLPALRPLLPGVTLLGLAWPARQLLIALGRPYRLCLATIAGLLITAGAATLGAAHGGLAGLAWGMSLGYAAVFLVTGATAFVPILGGRAWKAHLLKLASWGGWMSLGAIVASGCELPRMELWLDTAARLGILAAWSIPAAWSWLRFRPAARPTPEIVVVP